MITKRSVLKRLVAEELARLVLQGRGCDKGRLSEAPGVADADQDKKGKERRGTAKPPSPHAGPRQTGSASKSSDDPKGKAPGDMTPAGSRKPAKGSPPPELPAEEDPADDRLDADAEKPGDQKDAEAAKDPLDGEKGKVGDEIVGKTVQSITMDPKSKVLPGAIEIVITFNEVTDPLKILIPKSGVPKFFWRGIHNSL